MRLGFRQCGFRQLGFRHLVVALAALSVGFLLGSARVGNESGTASLGTTISSSAQASNTPAAGR